ncbi:hypothetical protein T439DRAFT_322678 [Meredithblackwellia eburnea MCA 4105]
MSALTTGGNTASGSGGGGSGAVRQRAYSDQQRRHSHFSASPESQLESLVSAARTFQAVLSEFDPNCLVHLPTLDPIFSSLSQIQTTVEFILRVLFDFERSRSSSSLIHHSLDGDSRLAPIRSTSAGSTGPGALQVFGPNPEYPISPTEPSTLRAYIGPLQATSGATSPSLDPGWNRLPAPVRSPIDSTHGSLPTLSLPPMRTSFPPPATTTSSGPSRGTLQLASSPALPPLPTSSTTLKPTPVSTSSSPPHLGPPTTTKKLGKPSATTNASSSHQTSPQTSSGEPEEYPYPWGHPSKFPLSDYYTWTSGIWHCNHSHCVSSNAALSSSSPYPTTTTAESEDPSSSPGTLNTAAATVGMGTNPTVMGPKRRLFGMYRASKACPSSILKRAREHVIKHLDDDREAEKLRLGSLNGDDDNEGGNEKSGGKRGGGRGRGRKDEPREDPWKKGGGVAELLLKAAAVSGKAGEEGLGIKRAHPESSSSSSPEERGGSESGSGSNKKAREEGLEWGAKGRKSSAAALHAGTR